jgi:hypothetical protein
MGPRKSLHAHAPGHHGAEGQRRRCRGCSCNAWERPVGVTERARHTPRRPVSEGVLLNIVRRALTTAAIGSTAVAGVAVIGATAAQAAKLIPTSLSIAVPQGHQVTYGKPATVTGDLTNTVTHKPLSGVTVQLRERRPGASKWTWVPGSATTQSNGSVSLSTLPLKTTEQVQLVAPKTTTTEAATSGVETIKVAYLVTAVLSNNTVTVTVAPSAAHQTVQLQMLGKKGWATVQTGKLGAGSSTTFTIKAKGSYHAVKPASSGFLQGTSNKVVF